MISLAVQLLPALCFAVVRHIGKCKLAIGQPVIKLRIRICQPGDQAAMHTGGLVRKTI